MIKEVVSDDPGLHEPAVEYSPAKEEAVNESEKIAE
jgi:hypothetical protein